MDDRKLDTIERALVSHLRNRRAAAVPAGFSAQVMRAVRENAERRLDFWDFFGVAVRRFAPVGALAATAVCGYAQLVDKAFGQALLSVSLHGGATSMLYAGMLP
jgi:hypothetical protein